MTSADRPRRALVTGASRGIGAAIAVALAEAGHVVVGTGRSEGALKQVAADAKGDLIPLVADMADPAAVRAAGVSAAAAAGGPLEIVVHCAGVAPSLPIGRTTLEVWDETHRVNVTAALALVQEALPDMLSAGWGRVLTVGSLYSRMGAKYAAAYASSKHALLGLTRVIAAETAGKGITANCIVPGWTDTVMVRDEIADVAAARGWSQEQALELILRNQPLGRMVTPAEVAALAVFLAGEPAASMTGQAINVDGGSLHS